jgi:hypothetical protein
MSLAASGGSGHGGMASNAGISERPSRVSLDGYNYGRGVVRPNPETVYEGFASNSPPPPLPPGAAPSGSTCERPPILTRHSIHIDPSNHDYGAMSPPDRLPLSPGFALHSSPVTQMTGSPTMMFGGLGGTKGTGDEDERRELAGRKKEGVLWGLGSWDGLSKAGGRSSRWESECWAERLKTVHKVSKENTR